MPVTFLVNRNVQGIPQFASNVMASANSTIYDAVSDTTGNFYTCGTYTSSAVAPISNGVLGAAPSLTSPAQTCGLSASSSLPAAFVIKYNAAGVAQWAWSLLNATASSSAYNIITDPTYSNIYVVVNYISTSAVSIFNSNTNTTSSQGSNTNITIPVSGATGTASSVAVIKINSSGVVQWVSQYESNSTDIGYAMSIDPLGNMYLCGTLADATTAAFNVYNGLVPQGTSTSVTTSTVTVTFPAITANSSTGHIIKYTPAGVASTGVIMGQPASGGLATYFSLVVDPTGTFVYVVGQYINNAATVTLFNGSAAGGSASSATIPLTTSSAPTGIIIKYTTASLSFVSAALIGNGLATNNVQIYGSAIAPNGNLYVCGSYTASVNVPIYNAPAAAGASQLQASNTISLPLLNTGTLVSGFVVKFNSALTAQTASAINPVGTTTNSAMSNVYSVAVDTSDVNVFAGLRYVSSNITSGINVTSLITSTAATGTNSVVLPPATQSGFGYIRYFLGNSLHASTFQNTSNIFNGVTIGGQASTAAPITIFEDPTMTSLYMASSFTNSSVLAVPNAAVTNGLLQPPSLFNITGSGTSIQTPMVLKLS
jgi:hypothetical protein